MAREKKESPSGESKLEQYGVWVKVEPQELTDTEQAEHPFELSDLEAPAQPAKSQQPQTEIQPEQEILTVEEEQLLDELDTEISKKEEEGLPEQVAVALDEDRLPGISPDVKFGGVGEAEAAEPMGEVLPELELDDLELPSSAAPSAGAAPELGESEVLQMPREAEEAEIPIESAEAELPVLEELPEMESEIPAAEPVSTELPMEETPSADVEVDLAESLPQDQFDDLEALEQELAGVSAPAGKSMPKSGVSSDVLKHLEDELSSIRKDLTQLKKELSGLKKAPHAQKAQSQESGGFFDEEEDETIALTGDELDNILSTAEVTEESAEAAELEAEEIPLEAAEEPASDILNVEEPMEVVEAAEAAPPEEVPIVESGADTLKLDEGEAGIEVLPDLELEGLGIEPEAAQPPAADNLGELALEAEQETAEIAADQQVEGLEDLELEAEPEAAEAVAEPAEELESLPEAESAEAELEPLQAEPAGEEAPLQLEEVVPEIEGPTAEAEAGSGEEIDLEGLSLGDEIPAEPVSTQEAPLDLNELEVLTQGVTPEEKREIEIAFEDQAQKPVSEEAEDAVEAEEVLEVEEVPTTAAPRESTLPGQKRGPAEANIPDDLKDEIRTVLKYMDQLLEALPEEKIQEFASSEYFVMYKKLFEDLGLGE